MFLLEHAAFGEEGPPHHEAGAVLEQLDHVAFKRAGQGTLRPRIVTTPSSLMSAVTPSGMVTMCSILSSFTMLFTSIHVSQQFAADSSVLCIVVMHHAGVGRQDEKAKISGWKVCVSHFSYSCRRTLWRGLTVPQRLMVPRSSTT